MLYDCASCPDTTRLLRHCHLLTGDREASECPVSAADDEVVVAQRAAQMIEAGLLTLDDMDGFAARAAEVVKAEQARAFRTKSVSATPHGTAPGETVVTTRGLGHGL